MVTEHTCGFCGRGFAEDQGQPTCGSCPLKGGCQLVRCPHCGYENPMTPPWVARVRAWFGTAAARSAGYDANGNFHDDDAAPVREAACR